MKRRTRATAAKEPEELEEPQKQEMKRRQRALARALAAAEADASSSDEEEQEDEGEEEDEEEEDEKEEGKYEEEEKEEDEDLDLERALAAAVKAVARVHPTTLPTQARRQRRDTLTGDIELSPYLGVEQTSEQTTPSRKNEGVASGQVTIKEAAVRKQIKGAKVDAEALLDASDVYARDDGSALVPRRVKAKREVDPRSSGKGWFNLPSTELTEELKMDLRAVRMRGALDPKRFYKAVDTPSKFVQLGTVIEGRGEHNSARLVRKQRRQTLVDELLADQQSRQYAKRKYSEIQAATRQGGKKFARQKQAKRAPKWAHFSGGKKRR